MQQNANPEKRNDKWYVSWYQDKQLQFSKPITSGNSAFAIARSRIAHGADNASIVMYGKTIRTLWK